jgi:dienelactone hydrolase
MELDEYTHSFDGKERRVFRAANPGKTPIAVFHELPGLSDTTFGMAEWLAGEGFDVHLPLLFGRPRQSSNIGFLQMCVSREFAMFRANKDSPITGWLTSLCRRLAADAPHGRVGVIGMCATGGLVLSLIWDECVGAAVAAQPALPFRRRTSGIDDGELGASLDSVERAVASGKPLLMTAFEGDGICPAARQQAYRDTFGEEAVRTYPGNAHSTLTGDTLPEIRAEVLSFLRAAMQGD